MKAVGSSLADKYKLPHPANVEYFRSVKVTHFYKPMKPEMFVKNFWEMLSFSSSLEAGMQKSELPKSFQHLGENMTRDSETQEVTNLSIPGKRMRSLDQMWLKLSLQTF